MSSQFKQAMSLFVPLIIMILGSLVIVLAGGNDHPGSGIFNSLAQMRWFGWIGVLMMIGGFSLYFRRG